jgi:hypothetical protein
MLTNFLDLGAAQFPANQMRLRSHYLREVMDIQRFRHRRSLSSCVRTPPRRRSRVNSERNIGHCEREDGSARERRSAPHHGFDQLLLVPRTNPDGFQETR